MPSTARLAEMVPESSPEAVTSWDDVKVLDVRLDRLRRWHGDGVLCIGDAAHAMSPVGGVGINLAIADAVAAAGLSGGTASEWPADGQASRVRTPSPNTADCRDPNGSTRPASHVLAPVLQGREAARPPDGAAEAVASASPS